MMEGALWGQCGQHKELCSTSVFCCDLKTIPTTTMKKKEKKNDSPLTRRRENILEKAANSVQCAGDVNEIQCLKSDDY